MPTEDDPGNTAASRAIGRDRGAFAVPASAVLLVAIACIGCRTAPAPAPTAPPVVSPTPPVPTLAAPVRSVDGTLETGPTPTMSPTVARRAQSCGGWGIGPEIVPGRMANAQYADGLWTVEVEGLWGPSSASDTIVLGEPTRGPAQANLFVAGCRRTIDAASAFVRAQDTYRVTATPPPR